MKQKKAVKREAKRSTLKKTFMVLALGVVLIGVGEVVWQSIHVLTRQTVQQSFTENSLALSPLAWAEDADLFKRLVFEEAPLYGLRSDQPKVNISESFTQEILDVSSYEEVFISEETAVVGFWTKEPLVQEQIEQSLDSKGWMLVPTGSTALRSFVRDRGSYSWLLVQYTKTNGGTSIVLQYQ